MRAKLIGGRISTLYFGAMCRLSRAKPLFLFLKNKYYKYEQAIFLASLERARLAGEMEIKQRGLSGLEEDIFLLERRGNLPYGVNKEELEKQFAKAAIKEINKLNDNILELEDTIVRLKIKRDRIWAIIRKDEL
jgi:hypothetical protein